MSYYTTSALRRKVADSSAVFKPTIYSAPRNLKRLIVSSLDCRMLLENLGRDPVCGDNFGAERRCFGELSQDEGIFQVFERRLGR